MASKRPPNSTQTTPSGIRIDYWDSVGVDGEPQQRRYVADPPGHREPSVTTITGETRNKANQFVSKALKLEREGIDWYEYTREAGKRGTATHDLIVRLMADGSPGRLSDLEPEHRPWGQAAAKWILDRSPEVELAETMVAGPGFVGRFDLMARLDGTLTLIDFKTAKEGDTYPPFSEVGMQLTAYTIGCEHSGYPVPDALLVVRLFADGTYDETPIQCERERFLSALATFRAWKAYDKEIKTAWRDAMEQAA